MNDSQKNEKSAQPNLGQTRILLQPNLAQSHYHLGRALAKQEEWEEAIVAYRQALDLEPNGEIYFSLAEALVKQDKEVEAIEAYQKAIEQQPTLALAYHNLGDLLYKNGQKEEAVDAYQKAIEFEPEFSWSHNNLGDALRDLERWDEAIETYQKAIDLNPNFAWSHYNLAEAAIKQQNWEKAIEAYRAADKLEADLPDFQSKLGKALQNQSSKNLQESIQLYAEQIAKNPGNVDLYHSALELEPHNAQLYLGLGKALEEKGESDQAIVFYNMAYQLDRNCKEAQQRAFNLAPVDASDQSLLGHELAQQGLSDEAAILYQKEMEIQPHQQNLNLLNQASNLESNLDCVDFYIRGWAWNKSNSQEIIDINIFIDEIFITNIKADQFRVDLWKENQEKGKHGFRIKIPEAYLDGLLHKISAKFANTNKHIDNSPVLIKIPTKNYHFLSEKKLLINDNYASIKMNKSLKDALKSVKAIGKLAICAMYQTKPYLESFQKYLFQEIKKCGYFLVIVNPVVNQSDTFMSNSKDFCDFIITKENIGYDFGSWITALKLFDRSIQEIHEILLFNDSCYGPLFDLSELHNKMNHKKSDFWGITDSWETCYHVQSYFLVLKKSVIISDDFNSFCQNYKFPKDKAVVIETGELGLTQFLIRAGYTAEVYCRYEDVVHTWLNSLSNTMSELNSLVENHCGVHEVVNGETILKRGFVDRALNHYINLLALVREGKPINISHFLWDTLIRDFRCPFIKRELVNLNPMGVPNISNVFPAIESLSDYDLKLIREHKKGIYSCIPPSFFKNI